MIFLAVQKLTWLNPFSTTNWIALLAICGSVWFLVRSGWGRSLVHGRFGLLVLRAITILIAGCILLGPTFINEQPGLTTRPALTFLVDGSQSMQLGRDASRWKESLEFVAQGEKLAGADETTCCKSFRFGHRLMPLASNDSKGAIAMTPISFTDSDRLPPPDASDSRLADALRQLSPQIDPANNAGVVLLTDGRVRATESVERMAEQYGKIGIPIHVVPVGELEGTGDVAILSMVVEPRVRKYTENQLTLFVRSFGFTGQRSTVRIVSRSRLSSVTETTLAETPITLTDGAQSVTLTFRVEDRPEDLTVLVEPLKGELTERNNQIQARVEIDRTKLRVLYIEGDVMSQQSLLGALFGGGFGSSSSSSSSAINIRKALQMDEDLECTVLVRQAGGILRQVSENRTQLSEGFPKTRAELFAYDCVVFSNLGPDVLDQDQLQQLALWIEGRGGGLIISGSQTLQTQSWKENPLLPLLPIQINRLRTTTPTAMPISVTQTNHPIWRIRTEQIPNEQLISAIPPLTVGVSDIEAKTSAEVLATTSTDPKKPVMIAHRTGRGRVLVSTADIGGAAMTNLASTWGTQSEQVASKFWRNLVYWVTEGSSVGRRRLIADSDKRFYRPGDKLSIQALAYDEAARRSGRCRIWAMLEPMSLDDSSLYSPLLWPENIVRTSGEVGPRIAWGEELPLSLDPSGESFQLELMLSETNASGDRGMRIEMTAYEGAEALKGSDHGTQVDSTSLPIQILSDPFEQQNPLPNRELLVRLASLSGGKVLERPEELAEILRSRRETVGPPHQDSTPAWSQWWLWLTIVGLIATEWFWRRASGFA